MLNDFFSPKTVAIFGASPTPGKVGNVIFKNFLESGFKGDVYPINIKHSEIYGKKCYKSILSVPDRIDLAVISIPADFVKDALLDCGKRKVKNVVIISSGFKETGNIGGEEDLKRIADKYDMRIIGPNGLGVFDPYSGVDTFFLPRHRLGRPSEGSIAFISQSGATASAILDWMDRRGYRTSKFVSYGNAVDIDESDLIEFLTKDPKTKVICAYLEGVKDGRRFMNACRKCSKPIIVLKGGITSQGSHAVSSHTGSLAGSAEVFSAAMRQSGAIEANSMEQVFDFARTLEIYKRSSGDRVQVVTNGGGFGIIAVDNIIKSGLSLAEMDSKTIAAVKSSMPSYAIARNPIDLTGDADSERYREVLDAVISDRNVDMIALIGLFQVPRLEDDIIDVVVEAKRKSDKPIFFIAAGGDYTEIMKKSIEKEGVPTFSWPKGAVDAMKALADYSKRRS